MSQVGEGTSENLDETSPEHSSNIGKRRVRAATVPVNVLLKWGGEQLVQAGLPAVEAQWLLEWATGVESLVTGPQEMGIRAAEKYRSGVAQRRRRVPLQHIMGQMMFRNLKLKAGPGVFSVRPETEMLVEIAMNVLCESKCVETKGGKKIVDLCAGSGAIGLSIAKEVSNVHVEMVEMDGRAAKYLRANMRSCAPFAPGSTVHVTVSDALTALEEYQGVYDMVASNPPYVRWADVPTQPEAQVDPPISLYGGGEDGLVIPRGIVVRAHKLLKNSGVLVLEHGETQGTDLVTHALQTGFVTAKTCNDLTGRPRYLIAHKNSFGSENVHH